MVNQNTLSVQNNFVGGYKTEYTGLNFPENSATATSNVIYTLTGDVVRRGGFNYEANATTDQVNRTGLAISTYKWNNVGGDGSTQIIVRQVGTNLYFFRSSSATVSSPLSAQKLVSVVNIAGFQAPGNANSVGITECTYADGNGYLFVYHKDCDPFYCSYAPSTSTVTPTKITVQIRDFFGIYPEPGNPTLTARPATLSSTHNYNLRNQGWTANQLWSTSATWANNSSTPYAGISAGSISVILSLGTYTFKVDPNISGIAASQTVILNYSGACLYNNSGVFSSGWHIDGAQGTVVSYTASTGSITINVTSVGNSPFNVNGGVGSGLGITDETISISVNSSINTIQTWVSQMFNYPSNADIWWRFKNTSGVFQPGGTGGTAPNVTLPNAQAPNGSFIYNAFNQTRSTLSGISGLTSITTTLRPTNGTFYAGRVWYTGVNASQVPTAELGFYTWTENIYFSQIIENATEFGYCYQQNDPTDETFFDLLPTDGGVITIQGSGQIYKLFPVQNGLLIFAANGVWFITGSQGIGFQANDYTVTKIPASPLITSGTSFVNVQGWPLFWNEEGIYLTSMGQSGTIQFQNVAVGTILTYYSNIPLQSKKFARGDYSQVDYIIQWCFRSTNESSVTDRYQFDTILALNTVNKAFYIYNIPTNSSSTYINGLMYVAGPGGSTSPSPQFKYLTSTLVAGPTYNFTWSEENDFTHYLDWFAVDSTGVNYTSSFTTAYKLEGKGIAKWQPTYVYLFLRNAVHNSYKIQGIWEFATSGASGKYSTQQVVNDFTSTTNYGMLYRRHKIRGRGLVLQINVTSVQGKPFDIMGWTVWNNMNTAP